MPRRQQPSQHLTRRTFLQGAATAAGGLFAAPAIVRGTNLNEKLNIAIVGCGGRGAANLAGVSSENIVALVDVNDAAVQAAGAKHPQARRLNDFRKLYDHA
ncbi:MAG: twin-arginine translocation signal domain-containing protein, partial [Planctomycetaceae bacterium]